MLTFLPSGKRAKKSSVEKYTARQKVNGKALVRVVDMWSRRRPEDIIEYRLNREVNVEVLKLKLLQAPSCSHHPNPVLKMNFIHWREYLQPPI